MAATSASDASVQLAMVDVGNVLYRIEFQRTRTALQNLPGYNGREILFGVDDQDPLFIAADRGDVSVEAFRRGLRDQFGFSATDAELDRAWCAILMEPFAHAYQVELDLHLMYPKARMVLVSNISELHHRQAASFFEQGWRSNQLYLSYLMRHRKPDPESFLHVCSTEGVAPEQCILFDDSAANCRSANRLGIRTVQVTPGDPGLAFRAPTGA
ncbi:MAG: HAD-IA family hydrolase [Candidatus Kapaibacteriota bacterium]